MKRFLSYLFFALFALLCTLIGIYPLVYFLPDNPGGLLDGKPAEVLASGLWRTAFYGHIVFGGIALLSGWSQFIRRIRKRWLNVHRGLGKVYVGAVMVSGTCSVYLGFFATAGIVASLGFISLGLVWLTTTFLAYSAIRRRDLLRHEDFMIFSFAACFAAVTLRIWLPLLTIWFGSFEPAYRLVAWLCWLPNLAIASLIVRRRQQQRSRTSTFRI